jgi:hypothetical protein
MSLKDVVGSGTSLNVSQSRGCVCETVILGALQEIKKKHTAILEAIHRNVTKIKAQENKQKRYSANQTLRD